MDWIYNNRYFVSFTDPKTERIMTLQRCWDTHLEMSGGEYNKDVLEDIVREEMDKLALLVKGTAAKISSTKVHFPKDKVLSITFIVLEEDNSKELIIQQNIDLSYLELC